MKPRTFLAAVVATSLVCSVVAHSQPTSQPTSRPATRPMGPGGPGGGGGGGGGQPPQPVNLERAMKTMNRALRQINESIVDPANDEKTLSLINDLQIATAQAKSVTPHEVNDMPDDERARALGDYQTRMIAVLRAELTLQEAVLNGNRDAAKTALASLAQDRKDGHDAFGVQDHDDKREPRH